MTANLSPTKTSIKIGEVEYCVDLEKVPYLKSFLRFQESSGQTEQTTTPTHGEIPLFDVAYYGIEMGFRHCFRKLSDDLRQYHTLCETLEFLCVDVLDKRSLRDIMQEMREGKSRDDEYAHKRYRQVKGNHLKARDAAFRLFYCILLGEFANEAEEAQNAYNAVLFVVSHGRIFKYRSRKAVREVYEERFCPSDKQRVALDKWPLLKPGAKIPPTDDEATTSPSSGPDFDDSDFDFDYD